MKKLNLKVIVLLTISMFLPSCHFISSFTEEPEVDTTLTMDKNTLSLDIGAMDIVTLSTVSSQNSASISWSYDNSIISCKTDNYGAVITALKAGSTFLKATYGESEISCKINVNPDIYSAVVANPYVYASQDYINISPGSTQKIVVSLYGGNASDIDGFRFTVDDTSKAMVNYEGNYCWITGCDTGMCKLTINHNKTSYPYTVLVNCTYDNAVSSYITTENNIVTFDASEGNVTKTVTVNLVNPPTTSYESLFNFTLCDENGSELANNEAPVRITNQLGNTLELTNTKKTGECYLKVTHPNASYNYDLKILLRVVSDKDVSYVDFDLPDSLMVISGGEESKDLTATLTNYSGEVDLSKFSWTFSDNVNNIIEYELLNGNGINTGNYIRIKGKKSGNAKITIGYPGCTPKSFAIVVRNIESQAAAATTYITTSQNYIKMTTDDEPLKINIRVFNISDEDRYDLDWHFNSNATDGSSDKVVNCSTSYGTVRHSSSRSAISLASSVDASCTIEPLKPGTATITISHPKAIYPTVINVVVTEPVTEIPVSYLTLNENPILKLKYGNGENYSLTFKGNDDSKIKWEHQSDSARTCNISNNGNSPTNVYISAISYETQLDEDGNKIEEVHPLTKNTILVSHPECSSSIPITVYCYDDDSQIADLALPSLWTEKSYEEVSVGNSCQLELLSENVNDYEIQWNTQFDGIECSNGSSKKYLNVKGIKPGIYTISASASGITVFFNIKVYQEEVINEGEPCYLSTSNNVVYFSSVGEESIISVTLNNAYESSYSQIEWKLSNTIAYEVNHSSVAYGNTVTITSLANPSEGTITVSHPLSSNTLTIYLRTGNQYAFNNSDTGFISTTEDTITLTTDDDPYKLYAVINHTESNNQITSGFRFTIEDTSVATVNYYQSFNYCEITPKKNGITTLTVESMNDSSIIPKQIIVIVNRPSSDTDYPFIKTSQNVVTVLQGDFSSIECALENVKASTSGQWTWKSDNPLIADVIGSGGSVGMISGNRPGSTKVTVSNTNCHYSLEIVVIVVDARVALSNPYISVSDSIIHLHKGESFTVTSKIVGGNNNAVSFFKSNISNISIAALEQSQDSTYIKAISSGVATITISNSQYTNIYKKNILLIVDDEAKNDVYIKPSTSILKISPKNTNVETLTATLENGEELDAQNFIWWTDDYSLLQLSSVTNNCSISPLGISGNTKIHISHPKASKDAEILVLISEYENFAFSQSAFQAYTNQIHFVPMQLPAVAQDCTVEYTSENTDICVVQGSKEIAWICGVATGYTTVHAKLIGADKTEIASCRMYVNVNVVDPKKPYITTSDVIYNMNAGDTAELSATLNGENLKDKNYRLVWEIVPQENDSDENMKYIHFRNYGNNSDRYFVGNSCVIETSSSRIKEASNRQYILNVYYYEDGVDYTKDGKTHEKAISQANVLLIVNETGEITIDLSTYYEETYLGDGSFTINASLNNADPKLLKDITWSAIKMGGANIVSVTKTGDTCIVNPISHGSTVVIARLPTGATAQCSVIVREAASLEFDYGSVSVIPGYTIEVPFRKTPSNATIECFPSYTSSGLSFGQLAPEYFTYSIDNANCILYITGQQEYNGGKAGTLTCTASNNASTKKVIEVFCEYTPELYVYECKDDDLTNFEQKYTKLNALDGIAQTESDKKFEKRKFIVKYYPSNMDFNVTSSNTEVCEITERNDTFFTDKEGKTYALITVSPKKEGVSMLNVKVNIPYLPDKNKVVDVPYKLSYSDKYITQNTEIVPIISSGQFSNNGSSDKVDQINLGDGESLSYSIRVKDSMIALEDVHMAYVSNNSTKDKNTQLYIKDTPTSINNIYSSSDFESYYSDELFDTTDLSKIFGNSRMIDGKILLNNNKYYKAEYDKNGLSNSDYYSSLKGLIYLQKDTFGSENYLFTLGHGFDYYKRIPDYPKTRWDTGYLEQFVSNGYNMVDTFLAEKDMIFRDDNNNLYNTVKHVNKTYFKNDYATVVQDASSWSLHADYDDDIYEHDDWNDNNYDDYIFWTVLRFNGKDILNTSYKDGNLTIPYDKYFFYLSCSPYTLDYNFVNNIYINKPLKDSTEYFLTTTYNDNRSWNFTKNKDNYKNYIWSVYGCTKEKNYAWVEDAEVHYASYAIANSAKKVNPIMYHAHLVPTVTKDTTAIKTFSGNDMGKVYFVVFHNGKKTVINTNGTSVNLVIRNCEAYQSGLWEKETIDSSTAHWISKVPQKEDVAALQKFYKDLITVNYNVITFPRSNSYVYIDGHPYNSNAPITIPEIISYSWVKEGNVTLYTGKHGGGDGSSFDDRKEHEYACYTVTKSKPSRKINYSYTINGVTLNDSITINYNYTPETKYFRGVTKYSDNIYDYVKNRAVSSSSGRSGYTEYFIDKVKGANAF